MYFTDLELNEDLLDALYDMRFDECTPVQEQCIPHILEGRDLIGIAQTGTGKTAAYLLPLLTLLRSQPHPEDAVNCLIMAPTRELARQIDQALQGFAYYMDINGVAVYGGNDGVRYEQERRSLSRGADIVIATPGRLITHINLGTLDLSRTTHLVLDEADRMLDMGFSEDIMKIVEQLPKERQTILFSATMPEKIADLARKAMNDPVEVSIAVSKPAEKIEQSVYICRDNDKTAIVKHLFQEKKPERVIVFASSKSKVKELHLSLLRMGFNAAAMHSDLEQKQRDEVMLDFKAQRVNILVATDIVARGIDIDDITLVVNYDAPRDAEDYVHRIGRSARAGREGRAVTLIGERDRLALRNIEKLLDIRIPRAELPEGMTPPEKDDKGTQKGGHHGGKRNSSHRSGGKGQGGQRRKPEENGGQQDGGQQQQGAKSSRRHHRKPQAAQQPRQPEAAGEQPAAENPEKKRKPRHRRRRPAAGNRPKQEGQTAETPAPAAPTA